MMIERKILKNISNFFSLNVNKLSLIEDTRKGNHSKYQIGIKLNSKEEYNKILNLIDRKLINGCANITGGGLLENLIRAVPKKLSINNC